MIYSAILKELLNAGLTGEELVTAFKNIESSFNSNVIITDNNVTRNSNALRQKRFRDKNKALQVVTNNVTNNVTITENNDLHEVNALQIIDINVMSNEIVTNSNDSNVTVTFEKDKKRKEPKEKNYNIYNNPLPPKEGGGLFYEENLKPIVSRKKRTLTKNSQSVIDGFNKLKNIFPARTGGHSTERGLAAMARVLNEGAKIEEILTSCRDYPHSKDPQYVKMISNWLSEKIWENKKENSIFTPQEQSNLYEFERKRREKERLEREDFLKNEPFYQKNYN